MRTDFFFKSGSGARLHGCRWTPDSQVRAVLQIVHGIAEYVERYDGFANFLNRQGIFDTAFVQKMLHTYMEHGDGGPATGANYSKLMWSFFVFQQWYQTYMQ